LRHHDGVAVLPTFGFVSVYREPFADGVAREAEWMGASAATGRATAHLWQAPAGFVVPRRYTLLPGWAARPADVRVEVRASGGGLVPQGPGLWNLSLVWPVPAPSANAPPSAMPSGTQTIYRAMCDELAAAFARLGVQATAEPVDGSFCDGRYNLAVAGRKLVGTAQAWRRIAGRPIVMAHAIVVVDADPEALTAEANAYEAALGNPIRYRADALTSVAREAPDRHDIEARTLTALAEQFARVVAPRVPATQEKDDGAA
jgi:lipoate-protein ligase A